MLAMLSSPQGVPAPTHSDPFWARGADGQLASSNDVAWDVAIGAGDHIVVVATIQNEADDTDMWVAKYTP
jgi:hypothetical protein